MRHTESYLYARTDLIVTFRIITLFTTFFCVSHNPLLKRLWQGDMLSTWPRRPTKIQSQAKRESESESVPKKMQFFTMSCALSFAFQARMYMSGRVS